jgi:hypothetical protein
MSIWCHVRAIQGGKDFGELIEPVGLVMARVPSFAPRYNIALAQLAPEVFREWHILTGVFITVDSI